MKIFKRISLLLFLLAIFGCNTQKEEAIVLNPGPHLFIDNFLIADQSMLNRTVNNPVKLPEPVITGKKGGDDNFQPYLSVLYDEDRQIYRMWYNTPENQSQSHIGYIESKDGINWIRPHRVLEDPHIIKFGVTVLDHGKEYKKPEERYIFAAYRKFIPPGKTEYVNDGLMFSASPDGYTFKPIRPQATLIHNHDISSLHWDPIRKRYMAIVSQWYRNEEWKDNKRTPHMSVSDNLVDWKEIWPIMTGKIGAPIEKGETQFYAMSGVITRGDLMIGLVKILRDDINATPGKTGKEMGDLNRKAAGLGYTVLAWTRDGETWHRDHEPFLDRNMIPGTWDHAMVWGDEQIIVGDETYVYYGGYERGHKVARFTERQIGLARMPRDRYVAMEASINKGRLVTKPVKINANSITINANVVGSCKIRLLDTNGNPLDGYGWQEISGDNIAHSVSWSGLSGKKAVLEFELTDAQLFGFDLQ